MANDSRHVQDWFYVKWQDGPVSEHGVNGVQAPVVLDAVLKYLHDCYVALPNPETAEAIGYLEAAQAALNRRTRAREAQGVEGTSQPHPSSGFAAQHAIEAEALAKRLRGTVWEGANVHIRQRSEQDRAREHLLQARALVALNAEAVATIACLQQVTLDDDGQTVRHATDLLHATLTAMRKMLPGGE